MSCKICDDFANGSDGLCGFCRTLKVVLGRVYGEDNADAERLEIERMAGEGCPNEPVEATR